jgi:predicted RNase H-like HicB family nuclease
MKMAKVGEEATSGNWPSCLRLVLEVYLGREDEIMRIEIEREDDGRWIAEVPDLPGVMAYGKTRKEALTKVQSLALRVIADRLDHGEGIPELEELFAVPA